MMTLKEARVYAEMIEQVTGNKHLVFRTPDNAPCNQYPANVFSTGRYATCQENERADYEAGGAKFV